ncbi:CDP-tyvelose epimerase [Rhodopirellula maiorica SM1]|uniref:CDP-tyvelose epimerase n=1 Tax=Rhodopirellula maiorica SM1 TaxID=1265738 RepID=M5RR64_9BACT|nr:NAD-dependent epimerase/dehydratase family protein [Rhodopirellula maiorica]EMI17872.1 CDP-tyvelose epimerase [Rhodopirellula maiorica SM1]
MKILITGICGFVGRWIAEGLLDSRSDLQLIGIDNLARSGSESNRQKLHSMGVHFIHGDLRCRSDLDAIPQVDWVIDCAALPSVLAGTAGHSSSRHLTEHNLLGTLNLLEYCRQHQSGLILLSTSRVYSIRDLASLPLIDDGDTFALDLESRLPAGVSNAGIDESFSTTPPVSIYGATKRASETMAWEYAEAYQFPLRINRCGVLAGAGQFGRADQGIYSYWIHSHLRQRPLRYIGFGGSGRQVRDCLHPWDVARLVDKQITSAMDPTKPVIANVSGGIESARSLSQLTQWCNEQFGNHVVTSSEEERPFDLPWIVLNSRLARDAWQWQPSRSTDDILSEIADHARQHPDWLELA